MIRRFISSFILVAVSLITCGNSVNAQEAVGEVPSNCILGEPSPGGLDVINDGKSLSSQGEDGESPATVTIDCTGAATLSISEIKQTSNNNTTFSSANLSASASSTVLVPNVVNFGNTGSISTGASGEIKVNMRADNDVNIAPGEYTFSVTLTVTPQ